MLLLFPQSNNQVTCKQFFVKEPVETSDVDEKEPLQGCRFHQTSKARINKNNKHRRKELCRFGLALVPSSFLLLPVRHLLLLAWHLLLVAYCYSRGGGLQTMKALHNIH